MTRNKAEVVVAGHICVDIIPGIERREGGLESIIVPGKLVEVGPAVTVTGGVVSNTGLVLDRLGAATRLMGKVGKDAFGRVILDVLSAHHPDLADGMIITPNEASSYSVIISVPGVDRIILHCPGTNDTFGADDVAYEELDGVRLFHFGYPPIMLRMYSDGGVELETLLRRVKERGLCVSVDMSKPDPDTDAGRVAWRDLLERVLPHVDVFLPSLEEILFMLDRGCYDRMVKEAGTHEIMPQVDGSLLEKLSGELLEMGVAVAVLKLGNQGLYARTTDDVGRLSGMGQCAPADRAAWRGRELLSPCFSVDVVGTLGSGDCTIAGFLAGLLKGLPLEDVMNGAVAVGACNVEAADAVSGIPDWSVVQDRIRAGWERLPVKLLLEGWKWNEDTGIWTGPRDTRPTA